MREGAAEHLKAAGEIDPICSDGATRPRADIHADVARLVLKALQLQPKNLNQNRCAQHLQCRL